MSMLTQNDINNATSEVLVAVVTGKVTTTVESLADAIIQYQDYTRFADNAASNVACYLAQHNKALILSGAKTKARVKA